MRKVLVFASILFLFSCGDSLETTQSERSFYDAYFNEQIDSLLIMNMGLVRHTTEGELVDQIRYDSMTKPMWQKELHGFLNAPSVLTNDTQNFIISVDKTGKYEVTRYTAKDTLQSLQQWEQTRINGQIELITWQRRSRSLLMDRDVEMTYQPQKGYRMVMKENAAWAAPKQWEIFAEFTK